MEKNDADKSPEAISPETKNHEGQRHETTSLETKNHEATNPEGESPQTFAQIGETLANERKQQKISIADVSQKLRITQEYLTNIEDGNLEKLPSITYVTGFIRAYARFLKLDHHKICAQFKNNLAEQDTKPKFNFPKTQINNKNNAGILALSAAIAAIVIYGGWYSFSIISTPSTLQNNSNFANAGAQQETNIEQETLIQQLNTQNIATPSESSENPNLTNENLDPETKVTDAYAINRTPEDEFLIEAIAHAWIEVSRADGTTLTSRLLQKGDTYLIPSDQDLYLTTGNAGGLNIRIGQQKPVTLGNRGQTLLEIPLDKDTISKRF